MSCFVRHSKFFAARLITLPFRHEFGAVSADTGDSGASGDSDSSDSGDGSSGEGCNNDDSGER
jgi:hypothetical protein